MSSWIVRRGTLERHVADTASLTRLVQEKRLKATDSVFHPTTQQWLNASDVPEIKQVFAELASDATVESSEKAKLPLQIVGEPERDALPSDPVAPSLNSSWGLYSRIVGVIGGAVAIFGGVTLLGLKAAGENSLIEALAHGIGIYCIGKGLFMISAVANLKAAIDFVAQRIRG